MAAYAAAYARALVDVILNRKLDTAKVEQALAISSQLREVLSMPSFTLERRVAILDTLVQRMSLGLEVRNFIAVIMRNSRLHAFHEIVVEYRREMAKRQGIAEASITTARKLDDKERQELEARVATITGTRVQAVFKEDTTLLGGVVLRIGSTVYDGSVRRRLERMKEQLITG
jgi:F-type H+-transporting ATPase subunit delta